MDLIQLYLKVQHNARFSISHSINDSSGRAPFAQLVENRNTIWEVVGSNPGRTTRGLKTTEEKVVSL